MTLCIDEDSGCVADADTDTQSFFQEDGSPSAPLQRIEQKRSASDLAIAALADAGAIQAWPLAVAVGKQTMHGLHRIDEAKLNAVDEETFLRLRKSSSLALAYAQPISMQSVAACAQLAAVQQQLAQTRQAAPLAMDQDRTIQFN